ncbi:hypothetical protein [Nocardia blacklockiae]|uniref:hypothetical protein n=1 Tax=Nocardia blacklockiae TaxID=480036 RepID=UPI001894E943|nr:hypothetical protein [Nocardia blacklockiae]MBF6171928.1 hypothetical protein [Nocardia blacklockiae]
MSTASPLLSIGLLVAGAAVGFLPTYALERAKQRHALRTRWDVPLFELCKEFTGTARQLVHLAGRIDRDGDPAERLALLEDKHRELRALFEQLRLLGGKPLQESGRLMIHHCWAVRAVAEGKPDPRADDYPGTTPDSRVADATRAFFAAARTQLGVPEPDVALPDPLTHRRKPEAAAPQETPRAS